MNNLNNPKQLTVNHLIGTSLQKQNISSELKDFSLESIIELQKEIGNKKEISNKQFKKRINAFLDINNNKTITFDKLIQQGPVGQQTHNNLMRKVFRGIVIANINKKILSSKLQALTSINESKEINNLILKSPLKVLNDNIIKDTFENKNIIMSKSKLIKSITLFNSTFASNNTIMYNFNKQNNKNIYGSVNNIYSILEASFLTMSSLISKPILLVQPNAIKIHLFFYWKPLKKSFNKSKINSKFLILNKNKLQNLIGILSSFFNKPVELDLTRLYYPHFDSNILANFIGLISNIIKLRFINARLFLKAKIKNPTKRSKQIRNRLIPSFLSGINIKSAGRIMAKRTKNRIKSKTIQRGSLARTKANLITTSRFTNKNKTGSFSITVKTGHLVLN